MPEAAALTSLFTRNLAFKNNVRLPWRLHLSLQFYTPRSRWGIIEEIRLLHLIKSSLQSSDVIVESERLPQKIVDDIQENGITPALER